MKTFLFFCATMLVCSAFAQTSVFPPNNSMYRNGWIDLNKNGKKDIYEDPAQPIEIRVKNLLSQMTVEEKTCQLATLYGWHRVLKDSLPTLNWKNEIWKDGIANIDEMYNGFTGGRGHDTSPLAVNIAHHILGMNEVQRFFIEQTRLGIPCDFTNEGIRGVEASMSTGFPTQLNMGMTWNRSLVRQEGVIEGVEARALGYTNVYAPIMDVAQDQRWGRLEEVYGEAPYLVAQLGYEMCMGIQEQGIASTMKHYAVYSSNYAAREGMARTDPQIPEREMRDIHLYPWEYVIKNAHPKGVMSSYNDYDGVPISGSKYWLIDLLRNQFGFKGYVVSDSDALEYLFNKHRVASSFKDAVYQALMAGMNVRTTFVPPDNMILAARELVKEGKLPMDVLDSRVADVLRVKFETGSFDHPYITDVKASENLINNAAHQAVSLRASRESIVLLKNNNQILPFSKNIQKVAVIGPNATNDSYAHAHYGPGNTPSINVLQGIINKLGNDKVLYAKGCNLVDKNWPESEIFHTLPDAETQAMIDSAVTVAKQSDIAIVVLGGNTQTGGESKSRTDLDLPGYQQNLIEAVYAVGKPVIVVLIGSQPITINWIDKYINGIIYAGYPGSYGGTAIADVLFGDYNPGGKLTLTFPKSVGQLPLRFPSKPNAQSDAVESARIKGLLYPFGFGLSYTTFKYSNLVLPKTVSLTADVNVSVDVTNTGNIAGDEVIQLYTRDVLSSVTTWEKNLVGFERVHLNAGETKTVHFTIANDNLKLWNREMQHVVEPGDFKVMVGSSSADIRLDGMFTAN